MRRLSLCFALAVFLPSLAAAQTRGWVGVNVASWTSAQESQTYTFNSRVFGETATAVTNYPELGSAIGVDVAAGVNIVPMFGVGVSADVASYDYTVGLAVRIPHPTAFNRHATATGSSAPMSRSDTGINISAVYTPRTPDSVQVRLFGGPTYFSVEQDMVGRINYAQVFNLLGVNLVEVTTTQDSTVNESAWGFHAGADVSYFFSRYVGVGGMVRFSRGTVDIQSEPLSAGPAELSTGFAVVGGGVRFRF